MKKMVMAVLFLALAAAPAYADTNALSNPGFETGSISGWTSWTNYGHDYAYNINNWGHDGSSYSIHAWSWGEAGTSGGAWQDFAITDPNQPLNVGGWIFQPSGDPLTGDVYAWLRIEFKNSSDTIVGTASSEHLQADDLISDDWMHSSTVLTPSSYGSGIVKGTFVWEVKADGTGSGSAMFDDMHVSAVPEPVSSVLFLLGGATLAVRRLRRK
ncbi:MAG: PEP-CTERM sorting domain-containing protein [Candidatus Omnitrophica bacterium]|nr:PEP-CTERM sorting domain-containing protein [Candidatus Omnitrophota bacterium]